MIQSIHNCDYIAVGTYMYSCVCFIQGLIMSTVEVCALCGFVFGVACKLPPSLTLLILNGCFCFPIGFCAIWGVYICGHELMEVEFSYIFLNNPPDEQETETETIEDNRQSEFDIVQIEKEKGSSKRKRFYKYFRTAIEIVAFLVQLGALVSIPVLLSMEQFFEPSELSKHHFIAIYILIPLSLLSISVVWSGWIQDAIMRPYNTTEQSSDGKGNVTARYKTGS